MNGNRVDLDSVLGVLKDFQRRTVDYVFQRMFLDRQPTRRFLVADEVGLGKTMVARGIIARTLDHLHDRVDRVDIVYVCSNTAIAQQNVNRLNVLGQDHAAIATRLTLLPTRLEGLQSNRVNFVSFTPGTTFDLRSRGGVVEERALVYRILGEAFPGLAPGLLNLLQATVGRDNWLWYAREWGAPIDGDLARRFRERVAADAGLFSRLAEACDRFRQYRQQYEGTEIHGRYALIGELRQRLARVCVDALEPDLVVLDEFQRFKDLLDGDSEAAELAKALMSYRTPEDDDVRVLLLSATPYRMLALDHEAGENDYEDFLRTLRFLFDDDDAVEVVREELRRYRAALYGIGHGTEAELLRARDAIQSRLRSVMVRTERVAIADKQDAMVADAPIVAPLAARDLRQAELADAVARAVGSGDVVEYWKSAPYLLNFMKEYELKRGLHKAGDQPTDDLLEALRTYRKELLDRKHLARYGRLDPANARLRALMQDTIETGMWKLVWLPPSLPYIEPVGAYAETPEATKALVFSSWNVVPDAIAGIGSYEAERRMLADDADRPMYQELYRKRRGLLRFSTVDGHQTGMSALAALYPCVALADTVDPLRLAVEYAASGAVPRDVARARAREAIEARLRATGQWPTATHGIEDQRWYWAALALLDVPNAERVRPWCVSPDGWRAVGAGHEDDPGASFAAHVDLFSRVWSGGIDLGRAPDDLLDVLAEIALGSPAVCALRALRRVAPSMEWTDLDLLKAAARIAGGFRTLFNLPETMALLRARDDEAYWRLVAQQGIAGNLQAVLDEYVHVLRESLGLVGSPATDVVEQISEALAEALSLRTAPVKVEEVRVRRGSTRIRIDSLRLRCRFAMRFGDIKDDQDRTLARAGTVRQAFNSPFRPFILATTSIGQEGLDFHPYCHAVYHWNLPSNPVDMEQREGRVHRYKGHAVRKNVALRHGLACLRDCWSGTGDPWDVLFEAAARDRPAGASDLVPYWVYEVEGGARIERRVPLLPFSKEHGQLEHLKRSLAVYRLAFGQPRQEDLLVYLAGRELGAVKEGWRISLEAPEVSG